MASSEKEPEASETDNTNIGSDDKIMYSVLKETEKNGIKIKENNIRIDQIMAILSYIAPYNRYDKHNMKMWKFIREAKERINFKKLSGGRKSRKKRKTKRKRKGRKRKSRRRR